MAKAKEAREETRHEQQGGRQTGLTSRTSYSPTQWAASPVSMVNRFAHEMERLFEDFGVSRNWLSPRSWGESFQSLWAPQVEVFERDGQLIVHADLPGLTKDDVKVDVHDNVLTIQGERRQEHKEERPEGYYRSERNYGSFYRSIPLPEGVDGEQAKASFRDGVLEISLPMPPKQEQRGRRIEIT